MTKQFEKSDGPAEPRSYLPVFPKPAACITLRNVSPENHEIWVTEDIQTITDHIAIAKEHHGLVCVHRIRGASTFEFTFDPYNAFVAVEEMR